MAALPTVSPTSSLVVSKATTTTMISCVKATARSTPLCMKAQILCSTDGDAGLIPYPIFGRAKSSSVDRDGGLIPYPIFGKADDQKYSTGGDGGLIPYPIFGKVKK